MSTTAALFQRLRQTLQVPSRQKRLREKQTGSNNHVLMADSIISRSVTAGPSPPHLSAAHGNSECDLGFEHAGWHIVRSTCNVELDGGNSFPFRNREETEGRLSFDSDDTSSDCKFASKIHMEMIAFTGQPSAPSTMEIAHMHTLKYADQDQYPGTARSGSGLTKSPPLWPAQLKIDVATSGPIVRQGISTNALKQHDRQTKSDSGNACR